MRITMFVGRPDLGGGARVIAIHAQKLQERGHQVTVIARPPRKPTFKEMVRWKLLGRPLPGAAIHSPSYYDKDRFPRDFEFKLLDSYRPATAADVPDADVVIATWWRRPTGSTSFGLQGGQGVLRPALRDVRRRPVDRRRDVSDAASQNLRGPMARRPV